jgi:hypothetical protein
MMFLNDLGRSWPDKVLSIDLASQATKSTCAEGAQAPHGLKRRKVIA